MNKVLLCINFINYKLNNTFKLPLQMNRLRQTGQLISPVADRVETHIFLYNETIVVKSNKYIHRIH